MQTKKQKGLDGTRDDLNTKQKSEKLSESVLF